MNTPRAEQPVVVIGAGLAGCLIATLLGRRGVEVTVFERRPDPRVVGAEQGRSINLALSARGLAALETIGLREHALANALPMAGRMVHPVSGPANLQPYSADRRRSIHSISRSGLNEALLETAAATPGVEIVFDHRLDRIAPDTGELFFDTPDGPATRSATVVLGADGAFSALRTALRSAALLDFEIAPLEHGYKELTIPPRDGEFALDPGALHIWARGTSMMIALPNVDRSFTCTLFWPLEGEGGFTGLSDAEEIKDHFARDYPDVHDLMPTLVEDYQANPVGSLVTVRSWPWSAHASGLTAGLVGDAAHAIVPFYGQGANCAFEDTVEIARLFDSHDGDWPAILTAYEKARKPDTDAIAELALENFVEMRDKVNSRVFRARSAAVHSLERLLGGAYRSRYELVSFSTLPYSRIGGRIRRQNLILGAAVAGLGFALARALRSGRQSQGPRSARGTTATPSSRR